MRRNLIALAVASIVLLVTPESAHALIAQNGQEVAFTQTVDDMAFLAGGQVHISGASSHDIFAAGGKVDVNGAGADHLILAGGDIEVALGVVHDLIVLGGRTELRSGVLADDLVAVGGEMRLRPEARINGSAVVSGGMLQLQSPVGRTLYAAGGRIDLNAPVGGDATLVGRNLIVGPNARIAGDLRLRAETIEISPSAVVAGRTFREIVKPHAAARAAGFFVVLAIAIFVGVGLLAATIAVMLPGLVQGATERLSADPAATLGIGALIVLVGPVLVGALFATLVGAPLALFLLAIYIAALGPAFASLCYRIGQLLRARLARKAAGHPPHGAARFGWTLLGAFALTVVCLTPILGALVWLVALIAGLGATFSYGARAFTAPTTAPASAP